MGTLGAGMWEARAAGRRDTRGARVTGLGWSLRDIPVSAVSTPRPGGLGQCDLYRPAQGMEQGRPAPGAVLRPASSARGSPPRWVHRKGQRPHPRARMRRSRPGGRPAGCTLLPGIGSVPGGGGRPRGACVRPASAEAAGRARGARVLTPIGPEPRCRVPACRAPGLGEAPRRRRRGAGAAEGPAAGH